MTTTITISLSGLLAWIAVGAVVAACTGSLAVKRWLHQLFLACDQLLNVLVTPMHGGAWADETLSARTYRAYADGRAWGRFWLPIIDALFFWQGPRHCERAFHAERDRMHSPPQERT
ncbi:MAG: hypothetical protein RLZZ524_1821 [Pseudomonadota bacterium]|jgi:hypothetical protein